MFWCFGIYIFAFAWYNTECILLLKCLCVKIGCCRIGTKMSAKNYIFCCCYDRHNPLTIATRLLACYDRHACVTTVTRVISVTPIADRSSSSSTFPSSSTTSKPSHYLHQSPFTPLNSPLFSTNFQTSHYFPSLYIHLINRIPHQFQPTTHSL